MKGILSIFLQGIIFTSLILLGTQSFLLEDGFSEEFSYVVTYPDIEGFPTSAIVDETTNRVYVTDFFGGRLLILDGTSDELLESIDVVKTPFDVGINPSTNLIYVGGELVNILSIIDATTYKEVKNIELRDPYDIAIDYVRNIIYVTSDKSNSVYVIDGNSHEVLTSFEVLVPCGIAVNPETGLVYVTSASENLVQVWDGVTNQTIGTIEVGESPRGVDVNPITNMIYVTNQESNSVSVIDGKTNETVRIIEVGETPRRVISDHQSNFIYVSNQGSKTVSVIDGDKNQVIETIPVKEPFELAVNSKTGKLYSMYYGSDLSIISPSTRFPPPLKQISNGLELNEIRCNEELLLVLKKSNSEPACVKISSVQKLIERGWATEKEILPKK